MSNSLVLTSARLCLKQAARDRATGSRELGANVGSPSLVDQTGRATIAGRRETWQGTRPRGPRHRNEVGEAGIERLLGGDMKRVRDTQLVKKVEHRLARSHRVRARTGEEVPVSPLNIAIALRHEVSI